MRVYRLKNKTRISELNTLWRYNHKDKAKEISQRQYYKYKMFGHYPKTARFNKAISEANRRNLIWEITFNEWSTLIAERCHYCNKDLNLEIGYCLDRKDNTQGYTLKNVVPCCAKCNRVKNNILTYDEMVIGMKAILNYRNSF